MQKNLTDALIVHCIDFRLQGHLNRWLAQHVGEGNYDRVALAGGVLDFETIFKQVALARQLHEIKRVILINHEDCGAYSADAQLEHHAADLRAVRKKIIAQHPAVRVETFYLYLNGSLEAVSAD